MRRVWALTDGRPGNNSQALGLAAKLADVADVNWQAVPLTYHPWVVCPSSLFQPWMPVVDVPAPDDVPDVIIAAGRRAGMAARHLKWKMGGVTALVQLMDPQGGYKEFSLLLLPRHDRGSEAKARDPNVMLVSGALHRLNMGVIAEAADRWHARLADGPYVALVVGGTTRYGPFTKDDAVRLGHEASAMAAARGASLLVTTSRRTSSEALVALEASITVPYSLIAWASGMASEDNPYPALLGIADEVIVTGESMSMISEACITGKPVWIADIGKAIAPKHHRFHLSLLEGDHAMMLEVPPPLPYRPMPLDETTRAAAQLVTHLGW